jgi:hypothetical protein
MILICSRGHKFDDTYIGDRVSFGDNNLHIGARCPQVMEYDRMSGTVYCRRVLHEYCAGDSVSAIGFKRKA